MANWIKYGAYWISAGIAVTGVLWFNRPADKRVLGEDYADVFEAVQERLVIPYLEGDAVPDWAAANGYSTNSIDNRILYANILTMAKRTRDIVTKTDGHIFWITEDVTNGMQLAVSRGSYFVTNTVESVYGWYSITNVEHRYSTNTFEDTLITSATRLWSTNSLFEYLDNINGSILTLTNLPVANLIYGRGDAITGRTNSLRYGSWWPFLRSYTFPWEQWSDVNRSRVTVQTDSSVNAEFKGAAWITPESLAVSFPITATNGAGYTIASFEDVNGNKSIPFCTVAPPSNNNGLYLAAYTAQLKTGEFNYYTLTILKGISAKNQDVYVSNVYGQNSAGTIYNQGFNDSRIDFSGNGKTNGFSIVKFYTANTNVPAIYFGIVYTNNPTLTNSYFTINSLAFESTAIGFAFSNAIASSQQTRDDQRITTNKLYDLCQVLTNLHRTVYIGASITPTNSVRIEKSYWQEPGMSTNFVFESTYGVGPTPSYYSSYSMSALLDDLFSGMNYTVTNTVSTDAFICSIFDFRLEETKTANIYENPEQRWDALVNVWGLANVTDCRNYGCMLNYPSAWAITNGYVKSVRVYAAFEFGAVNQYYPLPSYSNSMTYGGSLTYAGNIGTTGETINISIPASGIDTTLTKTLYTTFHESGDLGFNDKAVFNLIYQIDDPSEPIVFDMPAFNFIHAKPSRYMAWQSQDGGPLDNREEVSVVDYSLYYDIRISKVIVVVDWTFKHLGIGFVPENNTPEWRQ